MKRLTLVVPMLVVGSTLLLAQSHAMAMSREERLGKFAEVVRANRK